MTCLDLLLLHVLQRPLLLLDLVEQLLLPSPHLQLQLSLLLFPLTLQLERQHVVVVVVEVGRDGDAAAVVGVVDPVVLVRTETG